MVTIIKETNVMGTDFYLGSDGLIGEWGTILHYDPATGRAWQSANGHKCALTSFGAFGDNIHTARVLADHWRMKARHAAEILV